MTGQELYDRLGAMTEEERARKLVVNDESTGDYAEVTDVARVRLKDRSEAFCLG